ncbi:MAG TPA: hypothetical protein VMA72_23935 [Streptosporangiaceae bacterium]|nr:hypothetical protein [Streptosporangiaceae bacterium]
MAASSLWAIGYTACRSMPSQAELGSTRNAIYKTMFDAGRKLHAALAANGYLDDDTARRP